MRGWVWFTAHECMVEDGAVTNWVITEENDLPGLQNRFLGLRIMIMIPWVQRLSLFSALMVSCRRGKRLCIV
uniref:Uncharacterized protein n=1 Tax=Brassica oleracea TaxID=3712 RepID=A0A3P6DMS9_BRAOL|nr:unnamed protein product [Brassica oleracea]